MYEPEKSNRIIDHLPLVIGALTALFVASRILSLADFSPETAYAILQASGTAAVVVGASLQFLPVIPALLLAVFLVLMVGSPSGPKKTGKQFNIFIITAMVIFSVFVAPLVPLVVVGSAASVAGFLTYSLRRRHGRMLRTVTREPNRFARQKIQRRLEGAERRLNIVKIATIIVLIFNAAIYIFSTAPWLPSEYLQVRNQVIVGYILSSGPPYYTVLEDNPRRVVFIDIASVNKQSFCGYLIPWYVKTLPSFFYQQDVYPTCPFTTYRHPNQSKIAVAGNSRHRPMN